MYHRPALCLAAALCLAVTVAHAQTAHAQTAPAQTTDTLTGKLANLPSKWIGKIGAQSADLNGQVTHQTGKFLSHIARAEQQLQQQLAALDPNAAKTLFR